MSCVSTNYLPNVLSSVSTWECTYSCNGTWRGDMSVVAIMQPRRKCGAVSLAPCRRVEISMEEIGEPSRVQASPPMLTGLKSCTIYDELK